MYSPFSGFLLAHMAGPAILRACFLVPTRAGTHFFPWAVVQPTMKVMREDWLSLKWDKLNHVIHLSQVRS